MTVNMDDRTLLGLRSLPAPAAPVAAPVARQRPSRLVVLNLLLTGALLFTSGIVVGRLP